MSDILDVEDEKNKKTQVASRMINAIDECNVFRVL